MGRGLSKEASRRALEPRLTGVFTDLVTPFWDDGLDEGAYVALIDRQIAAGVSGVVVASGVAGERATLHQDEAARVIDIAVRAVAGRVAVLADVGSNSTARTLDLVRQASGCGASAMLMAAPWYNRPGQEGLVRHFQAAAEVATSPILIWDCPARTAVSLSIATLESLSKLPNVAGLVDATGDMARAGAVRRACRDWVLLSGHDPSTLGYLAQGGDGCLSLTANLEPHAICALEAACALQDFRAARRMQDDLAALGDIVGADPVPAAIKFALAERGLCRADVRAPITPLPDALRAQLRQALQRLAVST